MGQRQRDPEVVFWPSVLLEAWGTTATLAYRFRGFGAMGAAGAPSQQRDPEVVFWPSVFVGGRGAPGHNIAHFIGKEWFCGLGTPGLQKTTWPTKTFRDPFEHRQGPWPQNL